MDLPLPVVERRRGWDNPRMPDRPRILVTNDDGVSSDGIKALARVLEPLGEVWVVAPATEQSGASHALTLERPLRMRRLGERRYRVDGTPTDCVALALSHHLRDQPPALVVSGINPWANLGYDVTYSGTVTAAMEATIEGVPGIAVSLNTPYDIEGERDYGPAARIARRIAEQVLQRGLPKDRLTYPARAGYTT